MWKNIFVFLLFPSLLAQPGQSLRATKHKRRKDKENKMRKIVAYNYTRTDKWRTQWSLCSIFLNTVETPKDECLVSVTEDKLEASAALSLISGLEELEAGSSLAALHIDI